MKYQNFQLFEPN